MNSSTSNSTPSSCNRKANAADEEAKTLLKRDQFYSTYCRHQNFSLPDSIMHYIAMNPATPKGYRKMRQACKYFFAKNPIIINVEPFYDGKEWRANVDETWEGYIYDLSKFTSKFWITKELFVSGTKHGNYDLIRSVIPKLFKFEAIELAICDQILSYNDFIFLASNVKYIYFGDNVTVKHDDGSALALEDIFAAAPNCNQLQITPFKKTLTNITSKTMKELVKLSHFWKLKSLLIYCIPDTFDLDDFYYYMKKNKITTVYLSFDGSISTAYKERLENIIDEILQTETFDYKPPYIHCNGIDSEKSRKLNNIYCSY